MTHLLTVPEAASRLRLSPWTIRSLAKRGVLRPVRLVSGKLLFSEESLEAAVRQAEQPQPQT
jgi:excisionase family DNA binding protein